MGTNPFGISAVHNQLISVIISSLVVYSASDGNLPRKCKFCALETNRIDDGGSNELLEDPEFMESLELAVEPEFHSLEVTYDENGEKSSNPASNFESELEESEKASKDVLDRRRRSPFGSGFEEGTKHGSNAGKKGTKQGEKSGTDTEDKAGNSADNSGKKPQGRAFDSGNQAEDKAGDSGNKAEGNAYKSADKAEGKAADSQKKSESKADNAKDKADDGRHLSIAILRLGAESDKTLSR